MSTNPQPKQLSKEQTNTTTAASQQSGTTTTTQHREPQATHSVPPDWAQIWMAQQETMMNKLSEIVHSLTPTAASSNVGSSAQHAAEAQAKTNSRNDDDDNKVVYHKKPGPFRDSSQHSSRDEDSTTDEDEFVEESDRVTSGTTPKDNLPNFQEIDLGDIEDVRMYLKKKGIKNLRSKDPIEIEELFRAERLKDLEHSSSKSFQTRMKALLSKYNYILKEQHISELLNENDKRIVSKSLPIIIQINNIICKLSRHVTSNIHTGENIEVNELISMLSIFMNTAITGGLDTNFETMENVSRRMITPSSNYDLLSPIIKKESERILTNKLHKEVSNKSISKPTKMRNNNNYYKRNNRNFRYGNNNNDHHEDFQKSTFNNNNNNNNYASNFNNNNKSSRKF
ncbi:hypothetical protein C9374_009685 [Naegleria lovaniensis]|uniref:Uncharacterized protein n=1 Tax=Naegleria lovaniensis TaxID=51637 RepID=A0AA88GY03_NAELO|nr:uncharacterized protein C9374_010238 [Naegleria lovaniensis]XP_044555002.1 uncharacterized protein C9374_009685 [Naegleria lovaniensis]KAG2374864.1 hypothetical protein C9374_010238 [Naegleria lovaniensis]KAG2393108.1 hypothetical protein C9374_009685 [Naegleria lovaniensis]